MEAPPSGFTAAEVFGGLAGVALTVGAAYFLLWRRRQQRERWKERPPQEEKILRPAGYFAMCKVEELGERLDWWTLHALSGGLVLGLTIIPFAFVTWWLAIGRVTPSQLWRAPKSDILVAMAFLGLLALLWTMRSIQKLLSTAADRRDWRFGLRGEQAVAEKLMDRELAAAGYVAFHDLPAEKGNKKWNVDHIVVGPGGIFVLETKSKPRRTALWEQPEHEARFDGKILRFPWWEDARAATQVKFNAEWVRKYLGVFAPANIRIQPIIVVPGWYVPQPKDKYEVEVMNATYLVGYLMRADRMYSPTDLTTVLKRLDDACRTLEF